MRRLRILLLGAGIAVALSCSKDNDQLDSIPQPPENDKTDISDKITSDGIFEGEWRLSKYGKTCEGQIEVKGDQIVFDIPADYLFPRLSIVTEERKSEKASFNNYPTFDIKVDGVDYNIDLIGIKEKPTAVFDINTKLWTVAIPIDQVSVYSHLSQKQIDAAYLDEERPEKSAWLFIFRATRKIK